MCSSFLRGRSEQLLRAMWWNLLLTVLLGVSVQAFAFAPVRWAGAAGNRFVLATAATNIPSSGSAPHAARASPQKLVIRDELGKIPPNEIPYFTTNPDKTISSDAGLCLEARNDEVWLEQCNGRQAQLWNFVQHGRKRQIQLESAQKCLNVVDSDGGLDGAPVVIRGCDDEVTDLWAFEDHLPLPTRGQAKHSTDASNMRYVLACFFVIAGFGALGRRGWMQHWQSHWRRSAKLNGDVFLNVDQVLDGVCMTAPAAISQSRAPPTLAADTGTQRMWPAVMVLSEQSSEGEFVGMFSRIRNSKAFRMASKAISRIAGVLAAVFGTFYMTRFFENMMHRSASLVSGQSLSIAAGTGLLIGGLHTLAGPDHFAGLAPMVIGQRRTPLTAFGLGTLWGSGHATGQLLLGVACLAVRAGLLRVAGLPNFEQVTNSLVGAALIAIGLLGWYESKQFELELESEAAGDEESSQKQRFGWATYATGVLHGLSPDSIIFLAPAFTLSRMAGVCHVAGNVAGTLLSMGTFSALLSALCRKLPRLQVLSSMASTAAMLLGASILGASFGFSLSLPGLQ